MSLVSMINFEETWLIMLIFLWLHTWVALENRKVKLILHHKSQFIHSIINKWLLFLSLWVCSYVLIKIPLTEPEKRTDTDMQTCYKERSTLDLMVSKIEQVLCIVRTSILLFRQFLLKVTLVCALKKTNCAKKDISMLFLNWSLVIKPRLLVSIWMLNRQIEWLH